MEVVEAYGNMDVMGDRSTEEVFDFDCNCTSCIAVDSAPYYRFIKVEDSDHESDETIDFCGYVVYETLLVCIFDRLIRIKFRHYEYPPFLIEFVKLVKELKNTFPSRYEAQAMLEICDNWGTSRKCNCYIEDEHLSHEPIDHDILRTLVDSEKNITLYSCAVCAEMCLSYDDVIRHIGKSHLSLLREHGHPRNRTSGPMSDTIRERLVQTAYQKYYVKVEPHDFNFGPLSARPRYTQKNILVIPFHSMETKSDLEYIFSELYSRWEFLETILNEELGDSYNRVDTLIDLYEAKFLCCSQLWCFCDLQEHIAQRHSKKLVIFEINSKLIV